MTATNLAIEFRYKPVQGGRLPQAAACRRPLELIQGNLVALQNLTAEAIGGERVVLHLVSSPRIEDSKLASLVEKKGMVIPDSHNFPQLIEKISRNLGLPPETHIVTLDSESIEAFFYPQFRTVVIGRGLCRFFLDRGLELTEDHLAAVIAHELEHAEVLGDKYIEKIESDFWERLKSQQNHAEEYRADTAALRRLSRAGYNPKAMTDILRAFPLTHGRYELDHPEQIDRIRKVEDYFIDDEHPLSNTNKKYTPIDANLSAWFRMDSSFYDYTERLIHKSPEELEKNLFETKTQAEFWATYEALQHAKRIAAAKALVSQHKEDLTRLLKKIMIYNAFSCPAFFHEEINKLPEKLQALLSHVSSSVQKENLPRLIQGDLFRRQINESPMSYQETVNNEKKAISEIEQCIDQILSATYQKEHRVAFPKEEEEKENLFLEKKGHEKECYSKGIVTETIFRTLFNNLDKTYQEDLYKQNTQDRKQKGLRAPEKNGNNLLDLRDPIERDRLFEIIKLELARLIIKDLSEPSPQVISHLALVICSETAMPLEGAQIIARTMLLGESADNWADYLKTLSKDSLRKVIKSIQHLKENSQSFPFSTIRPLHQSYLSSVKNVYYARSYAEMGNFGTDFCGLTLLRMLVGRELYLRGCPKDYDMSKGKGLPPAEINLTLEEWDAVVEGGGYQSAWLDRDIWVIREYIKRIQTGFPIEKELKIAVEKVSHWECTKRLTAEELLILIQHTLWDNLKLQGMLGSGIQSLPHQISTKEERQALFSLFKTVYSLYKNHHFEIREEDLSWSTPSPESISSRWLDILWQEIESRGISKSKALVQAIKELLYDGISLSYYSFSNEIIAEIGNFKIEDLAELISLIKKIDDPNQNQVYLLSPLILLAQLPESVRDKLKRNITGEVIIEGLIKRWGDKAAVFLTHHLKPSHIRDSLLVGLIDYAPNNHYYECYIKTAQGNFAKSPDHPDEKTSNFPYDNYFFNRNRIVNNCFFNGNQIENIWMPFLFGLYGGEGRIKKRFPDLLARRFPFSTLAFDAKTLENADELRKKSLIMNRGWPYQRYQAKRLVEAEETLFDRSKIIQDRVEFLLKIAPFPSAVRDIHLEMMLQEEYEQAKTHEERIAATQALLPLFRKDSSLKVLLAVRAFHSEIAAQPDLLQDFDKGVSRLIAHLPEPSLARNHFLSQIENKASLTPAQLRQIIKMRMSSEGKKEAEDDAPMTFFVNKLGELSREEKIKAVLWLLGLSQEKPLAVIKAEKEFDGHLDNLPKAVMLGTEDEKEILFKRFFLGAEGIVDLEAVPPQSKLEAIEQKRGFAERIAAQFLPADMPKAELFRKIFVTIVESSDPSRASQLLIKLINKFAEAQAKKQILPPEEVISIALSELGIVGKKVAQTLAEQEWVPDSYKKALRRAQAECPEVSKRALLELAEDAGLLKEDSPIRIISFDQLIGAASNKQACLMTVEVTSDRVGLPKGRHQVVGKFKRPSAQKSENLEHDLSVLRNIMLREAGYGNILPKNFSDQISKAITRELNFPGEKLFADEIRPDLTKRNAKRKTKIGIPTIIFTSDDLLLETKAEGMSLRDHYAKARREGVSVKELEQTIALEAVAELTISGRIHADLHPGNIFVDRKGDITFIDLGMHVQLNEKQRISTILLLISLITGNETALMTALRKFGWDIKTLGFRLKRFDFKNNVLQLLKASQNVSSPLPDILSSVLIAASKLVNYSKSISYKKLIPFLWRAIDSQELKEMILAVLK